MQRKTAPFRADHVGSLLRSETLKQARADRAAGKIDAPALKAIEDQEIKTLVAKQEAIGLHSITDGEFRRAFWHLGVVGARRSNKSNRRTRCRKTPLYTTCDG